MQKLVRVSAWTGFTQLLEDLGASPHAVLSRVGLTPEDLQAPEGYLPYETFIASLNAAAEATGRPDFGLLSASRGGLSVLGVLGIAIRNARTVREAFDICTRFIRINNSATTIISVPIPDSGNEFISIENDYPLSAQTLQLYERILSNIHVIFKTIGGDHYQPIEYRFMHAANAPLAAYKRTFGSVPKFSQPSMGIIVRSAELDARIADRNSELGEMAMTHLRSMASNSDRSFADTSRTIAKVLIELGACTPTDMANALSVHERTLQRRLQNEGVNFEKIRDSARSEIASVLLRQDAHSLTEIAHILGYADSSTFTRSCQRWFGDTPSAIRAQAQAD